MSWIDDLERRVGLADKILAQIDDAETDEPSFECSLLCAITELEIG